MSESKTRAISFVLCFTVLRQPERVCSEWLQNSGGLVCIVFYDASASRDCQHWVSPKTWLFSCVCFFVILLRPTKGISCFVLRTTHAPMRICYRRHARVTGNGVLASITSVTGKCRVWEESPSRCCIVQHMVVYHIWQGFRWSLRPRTIKLKNTYGVLR